MWRCQLLNLQMVKFALAADGTMFSEYLVHRDFFVRNDADHQIESNGNSSSSISL